jgi:hypothetical protein
MPVTREELDSFHSYAVAKISNGGADLSWADLFDLWRVDNPTDAERAQVNEDIREGLKELDAGGGQPVEEFMAEIEREFGLSRQ